MEWFLLFIVFPSLTIVFLIFFPYRLFKKLKNIRRIKQIKINKLPSEGQALIVGKPSSLSQISPLSETHCAYWKIDIQVISWGGRSWTKNEIIYSHSSNNIFEIEDDTGKLLIDTGTLLIDTGITEIFGWEFLDLDERTRNKVVNFGVSIKGALGIFNRDLQLRECLVTNENLYMFFGTITLKSARKTLAATDKFPLVISAKNKQDLYKYFYGQIFIKLVPFFALAFFWIIVVISILGNN